jgi:hypothetical protein
VRLIYGKTFGTLLIRQPDFSGYLIIYGGSLSKYASISPRADRPPDPARLLGLLSSGMLKVAQGYSKVALPDCIQPVLILYSSRWIGRIAHEKVRIFSPGDFQIYKLERPQGQSKRLPKVYQIP